MLAAGGIGTLPGRRLLLRLEAGMLARNAPGGAADLLAATVFLDRPAHRAGAPPRRPMMEQLQFEYPAGAPACQRVLVGVVGSGDLEVMIEPGDAGKTSIHVTTSVDGYDSRVWDAQLTARLQRRAARRHAPSASTTSAPRRAWWACGWPRRSRRWMKARRGHEPAPLLSRESFVELGARARAHALLDPGSFRELAGPFDGLSSTWLALQAWCRRPMTG